MKPTKPYKAGVGERVRYGTAPEGDPGAVVIAVTDASAFVRFDDGDEACWPHGFYRSVDPEQLVTRLRDVIEMERLRKQEEDDAMLLCDLMIAIRDTIGGTFAPELNDQTIPFDQRVRKALTRIRAAAEAGVG